MGLIRGGLIVVASILLFLALLSGGVFWTISSSLQYEQVQENAASVAENIIEEQLELTEQLDENLKPLQKYCNQVGKTEFTFDYQGRTLTISCDDVKSNTEDVLDTTIKDFIEETYYQEYDCNYWNCFGQSEIPLFLVSQKSQDYWQENLYFAITAVLVLTVSLFFLLQARKNLPILIGSLMAVAAIPLLALGKIAEAIAGSFFEFTTIFFTQSNSVFLSMIITATILIIAGVLLKMFGVGFKFYNFFSKLNFKKSERHQKQTLKKENKKAGEKVSKTNSSFKKK